MCLYNNNFLNKFSEGRAYGYHDSPLVGVSTIPFIVKVTAFLKQEGEIPEDGFILSPNSVPVRMESDVGNNDLAEEANKEDEQAGEDEEDEEEEDEEEEDDEVGDEEEEDEEGEDAAEDEGESEVQDSEDGGSAKSIVSDEDIVAEHSEGNNSRNATLKEAVTAKAADAAGENIEQSQRADEITVLQPAVQAQATTQDASSDVLGDKTSEAGTAVSDSNVQAVDASVAIQFSPAAEDDTGHKQGPEKVTRRQSPRKPEVVPGTLCIYFV